MYFNPQKHILSDTLMLVAGLRLAGAGISGALRMVLRSLLTDGALPDMLNRTIHIVQFLFAVTVLVLSGIIMMRALRRIDRQVSLIPEEDRAEMARLQEEVFGEKNATLTAEVTRKLLQVWMAILVGAQILYDVSAEIYRSFATHLVQVFANADADVSDTYVYMYNLTHGFKYQGMLVALLLGVMVTGVFLNDRILKVASAAICVLFVLSMVGMDMGSLHFMGGSIGIVWSSVIFHIIETVGLMGVAFYLRMRYRGV